MAPMLTTRHSSLTLLLTAALSVLLPTAIAVYWAYYANLQKYQQRSAMMAGQVLGRADAISKQMDDALKVLESRSDPDVCSAESIALMRKSVLDSDLLLDVGYVQDNRLICSSFGPANIPLGPVRYTTSYGYLMRQGGHALGNTNTTIIAATSPRSGVTIFVHGSSATNIVPTDQSWQVAVIGEGSQQTVLAKRGEFDPRWLKLTTPALTGWFFDKDYIVSWARSNVGAYTAFAALPRTNWRHEWLMSSLLFGGFGLIAGFLLMLALVRAVKANTSVRSLLRRAIAGGELSLAYQPVVELSTKRWVGAEALLRWYRPTGESIGPDIFIPIAEKNGLMPKIRERLITLFEQDTPALFAHYPKFHVALNFCAEDFHAEAKLTPRLLSALQYVGANPANMHVEVTESIFIDKAALAATTSELRNAGIALSLDDFGTGFSSLSCLNQIQFDYLKIDKSFVDTIGTDALTSNIVFHIIEIAKALSIPVIAEGVETQAQAEYLIDHGVQYAQGWLFSKPLPMHELLRQLVEHTAHPHPSHHA